MKITMIIRLLGHGKTLCFDKEIKLFFLLFLLLFFFRLLICLLFMLSILAIVQRQSSRRQFCDAYNMLSVYYYLHVSKNAFTTTMTILYRLQLIHKYARLFGINWIRRVHEYFFPYLWYKYIYGVVGWLVSKASLMTCRKTKERANKQLGVICLSLLLIKKLQKDELMSCTFQSTCWKMPDLWVHVLTRVTDRVDCFGCVCVFPPDSKIKHSVFYNICVLMFMYYTVCCFTGLFYAVVRQISMLFTDNQDSVFCNCSVACLLQD